MHLVHPTVAKITAEKQKTASAVWNNLSLVVSVSIMAKSYVGISENRSHFHFFHPDFSKLFFNRYSA